MSAISLQRRREASVLKPCMDISMWKGYDPEDHSKNAACYEPWYKRMVPSVATVEDTLNKYQVCYVSALHLLMHLALNH